ncbi:MAG: nuclear transport factor 2 family protein [Calditrichaceae bacterium]
MELKILVKLWFEKWEVGDFLHLPISENFKHTSPFGTIVGKREYLRLVEANKDKFLGYRFKIHDEIYNQTKACVRYTAIQGEFTLDVSEWYYAKNDLIESIVSYYHIGEIRDDRKLSAAAE